MSRRDREMEVLLAFYERNRAALSSRAHDEADEAAAGGAGAGCGRLDRRELAAWTCVARAVLNLHETITRY